MSPEARTPVGAFGLRSARGHAFSSTRCLIDL